MNASKWLGSYLIHSIESLEALRPFDQASYQRVSINSAVVGSKVWFDNTGLNIWVLGNPEDSTKRKLINNPKELEKLRSGNLCKLQVSLKDPGYFSDLNWRHIKVGLVGAGYFLWFKTFGYSWVLQGRLGLVREMLKGASSDAPTDSWFFTSEILDTAVGFAAVGGHIYPVANIMGNVVVFPSTHAATPPSWDSEFEVVWLSSELTASNFFQGALGPHVLLVDGSPIYIPDMVSREVLQKTFAVNYDTSSGIVTYMQQEDPPLAAP